MDELITNIERVVKKICGQPGNSLSPFDLWEGHQNFEINHNFDLAQLIDHTMLKADATAAEICILCDEAIKWKFGAVCVNVANIALASSRLQNSDSKAIAVVGFPLGATTPKIKALETQEAVALGAQEIDMVLNIGALKSEDYRLVAEEIKLVVAAARGAPVKVILETCLLSHEEKIAACLLAKAAGAAFVKTSTGFSKSGATPEDIKLMRYLVGSSMGVKASGEVRSFERAMEMINAGASRIGTSSSIAIINHGTSASAY